MFLCGGGANCDLFKEIFDSESEKLAEFPIKITKLPKPDQLVAQGVSESDYDRISVAYGLSFDPFDIGEIIKKNEVDDIRTQSPPLKGTKCPKCEGTGGPYQSCAVCGGSGFA